MDRWPDGWMNETNERRDTVTLIGASSRPKLKVCEEIGL